MSGNVTCVQNPVETWWLNSQGENPCQSYQRLIRVCEAGYRMENTPLPPAYIISGGTNCGCTSVSYSLLSACWTCQWGPQAPSSNPATFSTYLSGRCSTWSNGTLSDELEQSMRPFVPAPWAYLPVSQDSIWSYSASQTNASLVFTSTVSIASISSISAISVRSVSMTSVSATATSTSPIGRETDGQTKSTANIGAIAGGIAAGIGLVLFVLLFMGFWFIRRRKRQKGVMVDLTTGYNENNSLIQDDRFHSTPLFYSDDPTATSTAFALYPVSSPNPVPSTHPTSVFQGTSKNLSPRPIQASSIAPLPVIERETDAGAIPNPADPSFVRLPPSYDPNWGGSSHGAAPPPLPPPGSKRRM